MKKGPAEKTAKSSARAKTAQAAPAAKTSVRVNRIVIRAGSSELPFAKIIVDVMANTSPTSRRNFANGMTELTRSSAGYVVEEIPNRRAPRRLAALPVDSSSFTRAHQKVLRSVPKRNRRVFLDAMRKGLNEAEKSADIDNAAQPAEQIGIESTAEFMTELRAQELAQREKNAQSGQLLPGAEMASRLRLTTQALRAALRNRCLFALIGPNGEFLYPAFFAESDKYDRRVLEQVCKALGTLPAGSKWNFFTTPLLSLNGKRPLDALAKGKVDAVLDAAHALAEE